MTTKANEQKPKKKPKKGPTKPKQKKGPIKITVDGLDLVLDGAALDDVELFDMLDRWDDNNPEEGLRLVPRIIRALFGDDQHELVMTHLRDPKTKRVTFEAASLFVGEAIGAINPNS